MLPQFMTLHLKTIEFVRGGGSEYLFDVDSGALERSHDQQQEGRLPSGRAHPCESG